jgi:2TM domain
MERQTSMQRVRGGASEPIELHAGVGVREAAREIELEQWAWRKVKSLRLLYWHLTAFALGNVILLLIDVSTPGEVWFYKVLIGWGLVAGLHTAYTYELLPWSTRDWEQRKARELMDGERGRSGKRRISGAGH